MSLSLRVGDQIGPEDIRSKVAYTILGDTAALAARLMAKAGEDEIWVAASAYERGGARFAAEELEPLQLKGKSEPQRAFVELEPRHGEPIEFAEVLNGFAADERGAPSATC